MSRRDDETLEAKPADDAVMLLDQAKATWQRTLVDIAPVVVFGVGMGRRLVAGEQAVDPLATILADEATERLMNPEPEVLAVYVGLEVAAARAPSAYGYVFRRFREWLMRAVLGVARSRGIVASVRDTTLSDRCWKSARSAFWVMERGDQLVLYRGEHRVAVLNLDRGMHDDFDA